MDRRRGSLLDAIVQGRSQTKQSRTCSPTRSAGEVSAVGAYPERSHEERRKDDSGHSRIPRKKGRNARGRTPKMGPEIREEILWRRRVRRERSPNGSSLEMAPEAQCHFAERQRGYFPRVHGVPSGSGRPRTTQPGPCLGVTCPEFSFFLFLLSLLCRLRRLLVRWRLR